jgi:hypothetical protein
MRSTIARRIPLPFGSFHNLKETNGRSSPPVCALSAQRLAVTPGEIRHWQIVAYAIRCTSKH